MKLGVGLAALAAAGGLALVASRSRASAPEPQTATTNNQPGLLDLIMSKPLLKYFSPDEFGPWYPQVSAALLQKIDAFRERWGAPVRISPAEGAIGRHGGESSKSQHNVDYWGEVRALDVFPMVPNGLGGYRYMKTLEERQRAVELARAVGFVGIGVYVDTVPGNMLHVDVRESVPLHWTRIDGKYNYGVVA